MALQNSDLLYLDQGGSGNLYQVTWERINTRQVDPTDELLVQRGSFLYQVPLGDFWNGLDVSEVNDLYLVERNFTLYHTEILFSAGFTISLSDIGSGVSTVVRAAATSWVATEAPYILKPDGTKIFLTATSSDITLTDPGNYTFSGKFTELKILSSAAALDASPTNSDVWNALNSTNASFGEELFKNINSLTGVPTGGTDELELRTLKRTFEGSGIDTDLGILDTSTVTNAYATFLNSSVDSADNPAGWDVSKVTNMSSMFQNATAFDQPIGTWDVRNVVDMSGLFKGASIYNQDLSAWGSDLVGATNMQSVFDGATLFNQDLSTWDMSTASDMDAMFRDAPAFNQDIGSWNVAQAVSMSSMFDNATTFDQDLTSWCVNLISSEPNFFDDNSAFQLVNHPIWGTCPGQTYSGEFYWTSGGSSMFLKGTMSQAGTVTQPDGTTFTIGPGNWTKSLTQYGTYQLPMQNMTALSFENQDRQTFGFAPDFYTGALTTMYRMFYDAEGFDNSDLSGWDTRNVTNMVEFVATNRNFNTAIGTWDTSNVTNMQSAFFGARGFDQDLNNWNTSSVTDISDMFSNALKLNQVFDRWDVSKVTDMNTAFYRTTSQTQDPLISNWNTSNVTNMASMFGLSVVNANLGGWDTSNVRKLGFSGMFRDAPAFNGDVSNFTFTEPDTSFNGMFRNAYAFNQDISMWNVENVHETPNMFDNARAFNQDISGWNLSPLWDSAGAMFRGAIFFNQDLSGWCAASLGSKPANFDAGSGFQGQTALLPQWGSCSFPGSGDFTIIDFKGASHLRIRIKFHDGKAGEITGPSGTITIPHDFNTQLTELGTYTFPMGTIEGIQFGAEVATRNVLFEFAPDFYTGNLTNMYRMFSFCQGFNGDISNWDTSRVTSTISMFASATTFNGDISGWDMSQVYDMSTMFSGASAFNAPIGIWDVSNVGRMGAMFRSAVSFNQPLLNWNVSNVEDFRNMFSAASSFNQYLNSWDVSGIPDRNNMANMFYRALAMEGNISNWCVPQITSTPYRFAESAAFQTNNALLPNWGVCTSYNGIYLEELSGGTGDLVIGGVGAAGQTGNIRQPDGTLTSWNAGTFANKFTQLGWYEIENMEGLEGLRFFDNDIFIDDTSETAVFRLSTTMDTSGLTETRQMFRQAYLFNGDVSMVDTSNVTNMAAMFRNARTFDQDISHFNTDNTTNMSNMFHDAYTFNRDLSQWNTSQVAGMTDMFNNSAAFNQDISGWCVPLIASIPNRFDTDSGFVGQIARQPGWGGCPADFTVDTDVVIGTPTSADPVLYTTVVSIATAATTTPASVPVISNQWQRSTDGGTTWTDIDNATATTYTVTGPDRNAQIRLAQRLQNGGTSPVITSPSNALTVENTSPPPMSYNEGDILAFDGDTNGYVGSILHGSGRFWTIPYDSEHTVGTNVNDLTDSISYELPAEIGSSITFAFGGGTILPDGRILWVNYNSTKLCIFDPDAATTADRFHVFDASIGGSGNFGFNSVVVSSFNNKAYGVPYLSGAIMSVDYLNETSTTFYFTGGLQYFGGVEGPDQKIYMTPGNQKKISILDPSAPSIREITVPYVNTVGAYPIAGGATYVDSNNSIYIAPRNSNEIVKLDFNVLDANGDPTISLIDLSPTVPVSGKFYTKPQITADGFLVFAPEEASGSIIYLDLSDDSVTFYSNDFTSTGGYRHSLMLSDGRIVLTPAGSPYKYGVIDTFSANPNNPLDLDTNYGQ